MRRIPNKNGIKKKPALNLISTKLQTNPNGEKFCKITGLNSEFFVFYDVDISKES